MIGEVRLFLVQVDGDNVEVDGRARFQGQQDIQHAVGILAARQAHHHLVAVFYHVEVGNGPACFAYQAFGQLVFVDALLLRAATVHVKVKSVVVGLEINSFSVHSVHKQVQRLRCSSMPTAAQSEKAKGLLMRMRANVTSGNSSRIRRSEEHTSELQSLMRISYAVFCLKKKKQQNITRLL